MKTQGYRKACRYVSASVFLLLTISSIIGVFVYHQFLEPESQCDLTQKYFFRRWQKLLNTKFELNSQDSVEDTEHRYDVSPHPLIHIAFIKTHKCASSSIQNMLLRYGDNNNLTFALPILRSTLGWPWPFQARMVKPFPFRPDILCLHSVFSNDLINYMPNDTFYFTSVREPISQWTSSYNYYGWRSLSNMSINELILAGFQDAEASRSLSRDIQTAFDIQLNNAMLFDLGLPKANRHSDSEVIEYIKKIDMTMDFVVVTEYFYESMIILRDKLGLTNFDMITFKANSHPPDQTDANRTILLSMQEKFYTKYLKPDYLLYKYFKQKVGRVISENRVYIDGQVEELKALEKQWQDYCVKAVALNSRIPDKRFQPYGYRINGFVLTPEGLENETCKMLAYSELYWVHTYIPKRQSERLQIFQTHQKLKNKSSVKHVGWMKTKSARQTA